MWGSNRAWNLWYEPMAEENNNQPPPTDDGAPMLDHADLWIFGVWIVVALIAVAILPFASRMGDVARAIASFCGFTLS